MSGAAQAADAVDTFDVAVIGAGPAGMAATIGLRSQGMSVLVIDEQPAPGGQIWRAVEAVGPTATGELLGEDYRAGSELVSRFRASGARYEPLTQVWQVEPGSESGQPGGWTLFMSCEGRARSVRAGQVVLSLGAQERPTPFPGWTLPGVLTVGAAQILLKTSRQVPKEPVWVVGSGPLPLLYMSQLLRAGGRIAGWIDTAPPGAWRRALPWAVSALAAWGEVSKGLKWLRAIKASGVKHVCDATAIRALDGGSGRLQHIEYTQADGRTVREPAGVLLTHEGVVPSVHMTQALECKHRWNAQQACLVPELDAWGQSSRSGLWVAGDGADIGGAKAAVLRGELVALGIARAADPGGYAAIEAQAAPLRARLAAMLRLRPMLDALYPPRPAIFNPPDETVVCRCEELTAGDIRRAATVGQPGPNQIKAYTRAGMGPCQGRQCGYTVAHILANTQGRQVAEVGFYRIRPPLKPLTLCELASLTQAPHEPRHAKDKA
ncbi:NAD(P)/FAD-dependent oxidoreductase [Simplicispira suum]|uniref:FAD/NAD(P)-binding oxidoreductase n=1 Tax=Simplicispira suum TaxID=2109915 RepID=A0A2S0N2L7_9BURK|nr:NAD(P)/FAD-dependent oxidoreductase [Simplicispira suum]AVO42366.1 FAD/NAD(P)-binding oxidoreductase [Simplicispira suum]